MSINVESHFPDFVTTRLDAVVGWCRKYSLWPLPFATACCGIEFMAVACSRFDLARFGAEAMRFSPRQSDLLFVAGRVTVKMLPVLQRIYMQMTEPKWVVSIGACASTGGRPRSLLLLVTPRIDHVAGVGRPYTLVLKRS